MPRSPRRRKSKSPTIRRRRKSKSPRRKWNPPRSPRKRSAQQKRCGSKCYLLPSQNKFPICNQQCNVDCRGLRAAMSRAGQYGYDSVYDKAAKKYYKQC